MDPRHRGLVGATRPFGGFVPARGRPRAGRRRRRASEFRFHHGDQLLGRDTHRRRRRWPRGVDLAPPGRADAATAIWSPRPPSPAAEAGLLHVGKRPVPHRFAAPRPPIGDAAAAPCSPGSGPWPSPASPPGSGERIGVGPRPRTAPGDGDERGRPTPIPADPDSTPVDAASQRGRPGALRSRSDPPITVRNRNGSGRLRTASLQRPTGVWGAHKLRAQVIREPGLVVSVEAGGDGWGRADGASRDLLEDSVRESNTGGSGRAGMGEVFRGPGPRVGRAGRRLKVDRHESRPPRAAPVSRGEVQLLVRALAPGDRTLRGATASPPRGRAVPGHGVARRRGSLRAPAFSASCRSIGRVRWPPRPPGSAEALGGRPQRAPASVHRESQAQQPVPARPPGSTRSRCSTSASRARRG